MNNWYSTLHHIYITNIYTCNMRLCFQSYRGAEWNLNFGHQWENFYEWERYELFYASFWAFLQPGMWPLEAVGDAVADLFLTKHPKFPRQVLNLSTRIDSRSHRRLAHSRWKSKASYPTYWLSPEAAWRFRNSACTCHKAWVTNATLFCRDNFPFSQTMEGASNKMLGGKIGWTNHWFAW